MTPKSLFTKMSVAIEKYPVEVFSAEILVIFLVTFSLRLTLLSIIGGAVSGIVAEGMKILFRESRPKEAMERRFYARTFRLNRRSFPSSHAAVSAFFPVLSFGTAAFIPILVIGIIVSYSRIYIKSHYPLDVIAGVTIGAIFGIILRFL